MQTDKPGSLSDKFGGFGAAPTDQLWDSIAASLDQKEKKKRGAFWWWFGGIAAGLAIVFSVYQIGYHYGKQEIQATGNTASNELTEQNQSNQTADELVVADTPVTPENAAVIENQQPEYATNISHQNADAIETNEDLPLLTTGDKNRRDVSFSEDPGNIKVMNQQEISVENQHQLPPSEIFETSVDAMPWVEIEKLAGLSEPTFDLKSTNIEKRKSTNEWEFGFSAGTLYGYDISNQKLIVATNDQQSLTDTETFDINSIGGSGTPPAFTNSNSSSEVSATVKRPLNVELSIARTYGKRWSLGSGVGLNYFVGQNVYTSPSEMKTRCDFLSVAFPVVVDFDFVARRRFETSVGLGVISEFPFMVRSETTFSDPTAAKTESQEFNTGYMGSVLFRTGISYGLNEHLKIGLSTNVRYYFHQSVQSEIPVLKRNLWGGVSLGFTWSI